MTFVSLNDTIAAAEQAQARAAIAQARFRRSRMNRTGFVGGLIP